MNKESEEGFIGRWSRRKRHGQEENPTAAEAATLPEEPQSAQEIEERRQQLEANRIAAEAVDLDAIGYESDLSVFYKDGVPALLKQAAMRKMWRTDPVFANLDGLNDYDHDYNVIDRILTEFKSAWQIGRGYAQKAEEAVGVQDPEHAGVEDAETQMATGRNPEDADASADELAGRDEQVTTRPGDPVTASENGNLLSMADQVEARADGAPERSEAEVPEKEADVRPTVSLRRRMAQFDSN